MHDAQSRAELVDVIRQVRNRWRAAAGPPRRRRRRRRHRRWRCCCRRRGLEAFRFSSPVDHRVPPRHGRRVRRPRRSTGSLGPLLRRVTDTQVALYLEERDPSLRGRDPERGRSDAPTGDAGGPLAALVDRLVEQAIEQCRDARPRPRPSSAPPSSVTRSTLAAIVAAATLARRRSAPRICATACRRCSSSRASAEAASPYQHRRPPGQRHGAARLGSGGQRAARRLHVRATSALMMRTAPSGAFERVPLVADRRPGAFEGMLFHLDKPVEYFVEVERRPLADLHAGARRSARR